MNRTRTILLILMAVITLVSVNGCYYLFRGQFKSVQKLKEGKELGLYECCSIYTMHMAIWMIGWPFAPEAAYEAFLMHFPHKKEVVRNLDMYAANGFSTEIKAKGAEYSEMTWKNLRYVLALNSPETYFEVTDTYSICIVPVKYTDAVHRIRKIPINTILFKYLQDKGILHPYTMVYYYMYV